MNKCPNCGSENVEEYCAHCGQRSHPTYSMREFVKAVADDQIGVDAKLPRTLAALFFKPGKLTREYMDGRIVRYIPPFRLYLFASVLFFVLLSFLSRRSDWAERAGDEIRAAQDSVAARTDPTRVDSLAAGAARPDTASADPRQLNVGVTLGDRRWADKVSVNTGWAWFDQKAEANIRALSELPPNVALRRVTEAVMEELPKVMFIMLPVYAFLLKLLYIRRKRYYVEHFIFALHVHAFVFALFSLTLVIGFDWLPSLFMFVFALYTFLAMKRVYQQGYLKTAIKWTILGFTYAIVLMAGLLVAIAWAFTAGTTA